MTTNSKVNVQVKDGANPHIIEGSVQTKAKRTEQGKEQYIEFNPIIFNLLQKV
jgi:hypothetical protein